MPRGGGPWMTVQQQQRRVARGTAPHPQYDVPEIDLLVHEVLEHQPRVTPRRSRRRMRPMFHVKQRQRWRSSVLDESGVQVTQLDPGAAAVIGGNEGSAPATRRRRGRRRRDVPHRRVYSHARAGLPCPPRQIEGLSPTPYPQRPGAPGVARTVRTRLASRRVMHTSKLVARTAGRQTACVGTATAASRSCSWSNSTPATLVYPETGTVAAGCYGSRGDRARGARTRLVRRAVPRRRPAPVNLQVVAPGSGPQPSVVTGSTTPHAARAPESPVSSVSASGPGSPVFSET